MVQAPPVAVVGCGRTGGSIGLALVRAGYPVVAAWSPTASGRDRARELLAVDVPDSLADAAAPAEVLILAVPDDAIEKASVDLAPAATGKLVAHTSGATSVAALDAVAEAGARTASLHPLQTLPDPRTGADALRGAAVAVTATEPDRPTLHAIAEAWGGLPFDLDDEAKPLYHAAAVFASNYAAAAVVAGLRLLEQAGVRDPAGTLALLVSRSALNAVEHGAITGPAARGDVGTISRHVALLRGTSYEDAYRSLAVLAAHLSGSDAGAVAEAAR